MQNLDFFLFKPEVQCPQPDNWQALQVELSFENNSPESVLNATKLIWKGANAAYMNQWVLAGLNGGVGIFEGIPLTIKICNSTEVVFNGIVDLTDVDTRFACDIITVKIRDKRMDMVSQLMDSVSFAYLATPAAHGGAGIITAAPQMSGGDYVVIPYQKNDIPDYVQIFTLGISIFILIDKIEDVTDKFTALVTGELASFSIIGIFYIVGYILYLAFLVFLLYELIKAAFNYLVSPVFTKFGMYAKDLMIKACTYFGIGFSSTIFASVPFNQVVIMPAKSAWSDNRTFTNTLFSQHALGAGSTLNARMEYDDLYNWQHNGSSTNLAAYGYPDMTPGDLFRAMGEVFNAKAKIILDQSGNPVLHFERWDFQYNIAQYQLPNISDQAPFNSAGLFNNTGYSQSAFGTNASELLANYEVCFQLDESDVNTYNSYEGTRCICTTRPVLINDITHVLLEHYKARNIPFAQAFRKDQDTVPEIILAPIYAAFATLYNVITSPINSIINTYNNVASTLGLPTLATIPSVNPQAPFSLKGHMLLTNHITSQPKIFIAGPSQTYGSLPFFSDWAGRSFTGVTIDPNNRGQATMSAPNISSRALMRDFHFSSLPQSLSPISPNLASPYTPNTLYFNQYLIYKGQQIPLCCSEYQAIKNNNIITTFDNRQARVDSLKWNLYKGMGEIDYRVRQQYTKNLLTTFVVDGKEVMNKL